MMTTTTFTYTTDSNGITTLVFDLPEAKVNKLSAVCLHELEQTLDELAAEQKTRALLITSAKPGIFIAGADIDEIADIHDAADGERKSRAGQQILDKLAALPFPTVAVIDGACLGGGLELALACDYRVATDSPKTQLGLPEVNLGIIPGFGGTQRLPRLVGLQQSLSMILSGRSLDGKKAARCHLVDRCVSHDFVVEQTAEFVDTILTSAGREQVVAQRHGSTWRRLLFEANPVARGLVLHTAKRQLLAKSKGHYPAPLAALEVVRKSHRGPLNGGFELEAHEFSKLIETPTCHNLIDLYYVGERIKKDPGVAGPVAVREIHRAGVLGAGTMGGGIAWLFTQAGVQTRLKDLNWAAIGQGYQTAARMYEQLRQRRKLDEREVNLGMNRLSATITNTGFRRLDLVVEAIVEDLAVKKRALAELSAHVGEQTIIASNTSTLSITEMATAVANPERVIGMHFFNPVNRMPLVEVIPGERTSAETIAAVVAFSKRLRKTPIVVKDSPGFLVNRLLLPYLNEAALLLTEGAELQQIDGVIESFGMPMGPLRLLDEVGLDVAYKAAQTLERSFGERMQVAPLLTDLYISQQLLGKKGGRGFYDYGDRRPLPNPQLPAILGPHRDGEPVRIGSDDIRQRMLLNMINEAARCLGEGVVADAAYLDLALITGIGFPAFRGGLLRYADELGVDQVITALDRLTDVVDKRFAPSAALLEMKRDKRRFYDHETH